MAQPARFSNNRVRLSTLLSARAFSLVVALSRANLVTSEPPSGQLTPGDIVLNSATGASSETSTPVINGNLYQWTGSVWEETVPKTGTLVLATDAGAMYVRAGSVWKSVNLSSV